MTPAKMTDHFLKDRYGDFWLTDAIRPAMDSQVTPRQGYRIETYRDRKAGFEVPVLAAAVSREQLFDVFLELLDPLGDIVDIVLETSHECEGGKHRDLFREGIDMPVLKSHCCDFEDLLMHDGCTGLAILANEAPLEVQFDEHKLLVVYAANLRPFAAILDDHGIPRHDKLRLITEGEHLHSTNPRHQESFEAFAYRLGVGASVERVNW